MKIRNILMKYSEHPIIKFSLDILENRGGLSLFTCKFDGKQL